MESPLYDKIDYVPGMLIQLRIPGDEGKWVVRNYSIASWPNGTNKLELIVTYLKGGKMSNFFSKNVRLEMKYNIEDQWEFSHYLKR